MSDHLFPSLYQINTRVFLRELGKGATLEAIPDATLDQWRALGFDWVWMLGVWQTGPLAREVSLKRPGWKEEFRLSLPDLKDEDISGSPFAVQSYTPNRDFGGRDSLLRLRERLQQRGMKLLLDFVPNHMAPDHPWRFARPEFFIQGSDDDRKREPHNWIQLNTKHGPRVFAYGRDPYFSGWPDTLQLNYRHAGLREHMTQTLLQIAELCDGIRCDMAMLLLPDVIARTWGERATPNDNSAAVDSSFWPEGIGKVKQSHPAFVFMAEVYWDREWDLQQQGFDYTYDKRLFDRLRDKQVEAVRQHFHAGIDFQSKLVRFLENHDEPRAANTFSADVHRAATVVAFLSPGLRFFYEGQLEGRRVHVSMHLGRRPVEATDTVLQEHYRKLLEILHRPEVRQGNWKLGDCGSGWEGNTTHQNFLAHAWELDGKKLLAAVNYGEAKAQCHIAWPFGDPGDGKYRLKDLFTGAVFEWNGSDLRARGLFVDLPAWGFHVFEIAQ